MDIAITGSTGLIGTALCSRLAGDGHTVIPVVRRAVAPSEVALQWDPATGSIDAGGFEGLDAVVHLAGAGIGDKRWTVERKREILESRTKSTALLATTLAGLDRPPAVLISGSAIGFYGERGDELLTEQSPPGEDFLAEICTAWEAETTPARDAGIRVATIRTGIVLSAAGGALTKMLPLFKVGAGGKFGSGHQWWSWISLDDEISAIDHLLHHPISGPVNLTAPNPETNAAFTKTLGRVMGRPSFLGVPKFGPKLLVGGELAEALLFTSARVLPAVLEASGFVFAHGDLDAALRHVLAKPTAA